MFFKYNITHYFVEEQQQRNNDEISSDNYIYNKEMCNKENDEQNEEDNYQNDVCTQI